MILKPEHWRARAIHARVVAECMTDESCRRDMLEIAKRYEQIAGRLEDTRMGIVIPLRRGVQRGNPAGA